MVEVSQFIDSFPTAVSDYTQASGPPVYLEGRMNDMRRVEKRKCDLIPAVKVTWDISPNDSVTVTLFTLCSMGIG